MPHAEWRCNWILHIVDHWSKLNLAFPLVKKKANHVVKALNNLKERSVPIYALYIRTAEKMWQPSTMASTYRLCDTGCPE